jgi:uncharacterized protein
MVHLTSVLSDIGQLDHRIARKRRHATNKPLEVQGDEAKRTRSLTKGKALQDQITGNQLETRRLEKDLAERQAEREKTLSQQNQAKGNEEYQALDRKAASLAEAASKLETDILEAFERSDDLDGELARYKEQHKVVEAVLAESRIRVARESQKLDAELEALESERVALVASLAFDDRQEYSRSFEKHGAHTIVEARGTTCQGCFVSLRPNDHMLLAAGTELVRCQHCGRILILGQ